MVRGADESGGAIPVCTAAADLLSPRLAQLGRWVKKLRATYGDRAAPEKLEPMVHGVRVAARRAGVALAAFKSCCGEEEWSRTRRLVRRVRRGAGVLRDADVHSGLIAALRGHENGNAAVVAYVVDRIGQDRSAGEERLWRALGSAYAKRLRRAGEELVGSLQECEAESLQEMAAGELSRLAHDALSLGSQKIEEPAHLHELRLAVKRLRYTLEVFTPCVGQDELGRVMPLLEEAQRLAGEVNDVLVLVQRLTGYIQEVESASDPDPTLISSLAELRDRFAGVGERRCERFAAWWRGQDVRGVLEPLVARGPAPSSGGTRVAMAAFSGVELETVPEVTVIEKVNGAGRDAKAAEQKAEAPATSQRNLWLSGKRLAVIDIGSNSIRLLSVELIDERSWRTLAEERAMTRLAQGMGRAGLLSTEAMARAVEAIGRFKAIADKLGVTTIGAFATAAVREAGNKSDFMSLIEDRTGLKLEVVSALDEGKLTHRSVARVYDLSQGSAAVVDIGGGSMEVVFSHNGVITENTSMPLGAVRVTEAFGGADQCAGPRFKKMRGWVEKEVARHVREHATPPTILVGCGGAFTTLLTLAAASRGVLIDRNSAALASLGPVARTQLKSLLKELRGMTLEQRLRVPGLPSDRADIIIAGLTAIERLMKHLGSSQVHVHPGGFREGLLLRMVDQEIADRARAGAETSGADMIREARDLAARCGYEKAHSEHVARLALSLFDQFREESDLIPGLGSVKDERVILEAAALLHDVGMLVEYRRHHRHSQTIIRHADLHTWGARQVELLATIARYHRKAAPCLEHPEFEALTEQERQLVRRLAGLLRVADGLDRSHALNVQSVRVRFGNQAVHLEMKSEADPSEDLKAARSKSDLLSAVLGVRIDFGPDRAHSKGKAASKHSQEPEQTG
jgi:exopolyphosphatase/guanosine-5'-triphosphate,3'-diphosphate pyrophosphatase